jgi:hypothetical protein
MLRSFIVQLVNREEFDGLSEGKGDIATNRIIGYAVPILVHDQDMSNRPAIFP